MKQKQLYELCNSAAEWIGKSEKLKKLIEDSRDRQYLLIEVENAENLGILEALQDEEHLKTYEMMRLKPKQLGDVIGDLYDIRHLCLRDLLRLEDNPIRPQVKWWSTMETMNAAEVNYHIDRKRFLKNKICNIEKVMGQLEQGKYKIDVCG